MVDVKGRWALITGASRGIGFGAAVKMAEQRQAECKWSKL